MSSSRSEHHVSRAADEAEIRRLYEEFMEGWKRGSAQAFAAPFTEDGDLIGFDGTHLKGRREITSFHQPLFDKWLKGTRLVGEVKTVRFLTPDVALMHAIGGTVMLGKSEPSPERDSIQTLVARREGGRWRLAANQRSPHGPRHRGTLIWLLSDLLWKWFRPRKITNRMRDQEPSRRAVEIAKRTNAAYIG